jgi:hypothetical protein
MSSEKDKPEKDASCCDPDKGRTEQQDHPASFGNGQARVWWGAGSRVYE